jgi:putative colanic acid biosynthesis acetyltransferase WcaF
MNAPPPEFSIDNVANRAARKYTPSEQLRRVLWGAGRWLLRLSPRPFFAWRRLVLRSFGARIGAQVHIYPSAHIYMPWNIEIGDWAAIGDDALIYNLGKVRIGAHVTISYRAHLCAGTHDFTAPDLPLLKPPIDIKAGVWIGTEAFIGPGVTLGERAIVGARAVVVKNVSAGEIVAGNPARVVGMRATRPRTE